MSNFQKNLLAVSYHFICKIGSQLPFYLQKSVNTGDRIPGCLRSGHSWFNWWISFAPEFQCYYFCESSGLFYLSLNSDFYVSKYAIFTAYKSY